jgi:glycine cleavage system H protein
MSEYLEFTADKFVFKVKKDLLYSKDETWIKSETHGTVRVGITDFAQRRAGDIIIAEVKPNATDVKTNGLLGSYETVKVIQDILSPIEGIIIETNPLIYSKPEVINIDPYGNGWIAIIKLKSSAEGILSADEYFELMKAKVMNELKKIKEQ